MTTKSIMDYYIIKVWGQSESDWRSAMPEDISVLINSAGDKNITNLEWQIISQQIELLLNEGEIEKATEALKLWVDKMHKGYSAPVCRFQRDMQNGKRPYQGGHSFFGAFREASDSLFPQFFYQRGKKGQTGVPSKKHLRKSCIVHPHHVFFERMDGETISEPDGVQGQQPIGEVKGFAYYEIIRHPFKFQYHLRINPKTKQFSKYLSDPKKVVEAINQSAWYGQGGCRGAGYGMWTVTKTEVVTPS